MDIGSPMRTLGIFVGVDEQQDEAIKVLPFAARDAQILNAIFSDANEQFHGNEDSASTDTICLIGKSATLAAVRDAIQSGAIRSKTNRYDLALIHFSCHGTPDGELLLYDGIDGKEHETGLPLDELIEAVNNIVATQVVVAFDTCFSGLAAGLPKVKPEDAGSLAHGLVQKIRVLGNGNRAVLMAAQANERAWESSRTRHGLLSHGLISGLEGTTLSSGNGQVSISRWIQHAVSVVLEEAKALGVTQTPELFIGITGDPTMPAFRAGPRRQAMREALALHQITDDTESLAAYDIAPAIRSSIKDLMRGMNLNALQVRAVNEGGAMAGKSVLVAAPTAAGKTMVGYLAALSAVARRGRAVVLLPSRALVNEKWSEFRGAFGAHDVASIRSLGGIDDDDHALRSNHYGVAFLTYEKFLGLVLSNPQVLDAISTVVLDEVHLISDEARGRSVELLLAYFHRRAERGANTQIVALSAALSELNKFDSWLNAALIAENVRPVPLRLGVLLPTGRFRFVDSDTGDVGVLEGLFPPIAGRGPGEFPESVQGRIAEALGCRLLSENPDETLLLFRFTKKNTRELASSLATRLVLRRCDSPLEKLTVKASGRDDSSISTELHRMLERGVGFHLRDLKDEEREAIESAFRSGQLRALVATSGLAMGVNTPASSVVIVDAEKFDGEKKPYKVAEVKNMAGRAGRMMDNNKRGVAYLCAVDAQHADALFDRYVLGQPEPLESQLSRLQPEDLTLALLMLTGRTTEGGLLDTARSTFDGFQHQDADWRNRKRVELRRAVEELAKDGFVAIHQHESFEPTGLGRILGRSGVTVASAIAVITGARTLVAAGHALDAGALITLAQLTSELDAAAFIQASFGEVGGWTHFLHERFTDRPHLVEMVASDAEKRATRGLKRLFAVSSWVVGTPIRSIEKDINRMQGTILPMAGFISQTADRTTAMMRPLGKILTLIFPDQADSIKKNVLDLLPRLEVGVARAEAPLTRLGLGLTRMELKELSKLKIIDFELLRAALKAQRPDVIEIFASSRAADIASKMDAKAANAAKQQELERAAQYAMFDEQAEERPSFSEI